MVTLTGIQQGVLRERNAGGLGQERGQGDAFWLQALVQSVKFVRGDGVTHTELRNLAQYTVLFQILLNLNKHREKWQVHLVPGQHGSAFRSACISW